MTQMKIKINNMSMSSSAQGEMAATDIPLQHVFQDMELGLVTENEAVELLDAINLPQLPMERKLGRFGAFEYMVKAESPTVDGKKGSQGVNLSDDYLWVVHPQVESLRNQGKKLTREEALKIVNRTILSQREQKLRLASDRKLAGKLEKHVKDNNMIVLFSDDEYDQAAEQAGAGKGTGGWSVEYDKDINIVNAKGQIKQVSLRAGQFFTTESKAGNGTVFANTIFHEANGGSVRKFVSGMSKADYNAWADKWIKKITASVSNKLSGRVQEHFQKIYDSPEDKLTEIFSPSNNVQAVKRDLAFLRDRLVNAPDFGLEKEHGFIELLDDAGQNLNKDNLD